MKKIFKLIAIFTLIVLTGNFIYTKEVKAFMKEPKIKLNSMTIDQLIEYGNSNGLKIKITDDKLVNKKELINVIETMILIPSEVNLQNSNYVNNIQKTDISTFGLTEGISPNNTQSTTYTTILTGNYTCTIRIYIRYDMLVDYISGQRTLYEVKAITSDSVVAPITGASYNQLDSWVDRKSSNSAVVKGIGVYTWNLVYGSVTRQLNYVASFTMY